MYIDILKCWWCEKDVYEDKWLKGHVVWGFQCCFPSNCSARLFVEELFLYRINLFPNITKLKNHNNCPYFPHFSTGWQRIRFEDVRIFQIRSSNILYGSSLFNCSFVFPTVQLTAGMERMVNLWYIMVTRWRPKWNFVTSYLISTTLPFLITSKKALHWKPNGLTKYYGKILIFFFWWSK